MGVSNRIKKLRNENGLTQQELADKIGVSRPTIAGYEARGKEPPYETLKKIADCFNVSIDYMLGRSQERNPADKIINKNKQKEVEVKELLDRYNVMLDGEALDKDAKESVIDLLRFLRDRDKKKSESD